MSEKDCFIIAPIGEAESDTRKRSDQILKHVITPALEECGYKATRADHISEPGMITSQIIQHIVDDPLVVADLTGRNPNVFYELAIRHAIRKPLVQLIKKGEQIPFDVAGTRTIYVDHHDLDSVEEAKKEIIAQINALEKNPSNVETPISVSLDLQLLRQSDNPEQRSLADVLSVMSELRNSVANIESRLERTEAKSVWRDISEVNARVGSGGRWRAPNVEGDTVIGKQVIGDEINRLLSREPASAKESAEIEKRVSQLRELLRKID